MNSQKNWKYIFYFNESEHQDLISNRIQNIFNEKIINIDEK